MKVLTDHLALHSSDCLGSQNRASTRSLSNINCTCCDLIITLSPWALAQPFNVGPQGVRKNLGSHIDASHSRQPLVKGERLVRYEVNAVMPLCVHNGGCPKFGTTLQLPADTYQLNAPACHCKQSVSDWHQPCQKTSTTQYYDNNSNNTTTTTTATTTTATTTTATTTATTTTATTTTTTTTTNYLFCKTWFKGRHPDLQVSGMACAKNVACNMQDNAP